VEPRLKLIYVDETGIS